MALISASCMTRTLEAHKLESTQWKLVKYKYNMERCSLLTKGRLYTTASKPLSTIYSQCNALLYMDSIVHSSDY